MSVRSGDSRLGVGSFGVFVGLGGFGVFGVVVGFAEIAIVVIKSFLCILKINAEKEINKDILFFKVVYIASKLEI